MVGYCPEETGARALDSICNNMFTKILFGLEKYADEKKLIKITPDLARELINLYRWFVTITKYYRRYSTHDRTHDTANAPSTGSSRHRSASASPTWSPADAPGRCRHNSWPRCCRPPHSGPCLIPTSGGPVRSSALLWHAVPRPSPCVFWYAFGSVFC